MSGNIDITIWWRQTRNGNVKVETSPDKIPEEKRGSFQALTATMEPMTWGTYNELQERCSGKSDEGLGDELDWAKYKEEKLLTVMVEWDAKDDQGRHIPLTKEAVFSLHPKVAETLLSEYDKRTLMGEEEKMKLVRTIHSYYFSQVMGGKSMAAPREIIELGLMEKFNWTPDQIDKIHFGRMQRLFAAMEQKDVSLHDAELTKQHNTPKKKQH
jgi:hypothetical protein